MECKVTKCTTYDVFEVHRLVSQLKDSPLDENVFTEKFAKNLGDANVSYWILKMSGKTVGFASVHTSFLLHHDLPVNEIQEFVVDDALRGRGLGSILMNFIVEHYRGEELELASNKKRTGSKRFFERFNFVATHNKFVRGRQ